MCSERPTTCHKESEVAHASADMGCNARIRTGLREVTNDEKWERIHACTEALGVFKLPWAPRNSPKTHSREGELQGVSRLTYSRRVCTVDMQLTRQVSPIAGLAHREQWMTKCDDGQRGHNLQEVRE